MRSSDSQLFKVRTPFSLPSANVALILAIFALGSILAIVAMNWSLKSKNNVVEMNEVEVFHYFHLYEPSRDPGETIPLIPEVIKDQNKVFPILNGLLQDTLRQVGDAEPVLYTWLFMKNTGLGEKCINIELIQSRYKGQPIIIDSDSPLDDSRRPLPLFSLPESINERTWALLVHIEESVPLPNRPDVFIVEPPEGLSFRVYLGLSNKKSNKNCSEPLEIIPLKTVETNLTDLFGGD